MDTMLEATSCSFSVSKRGSEDFLVRYRVRQYVDGIGNYYVLRDWQDVSGGLEEFSLWVPKGYVMAGYPTLLEFQFMTADRPQFALGTGTEISDIRIQFTKWVLESRLVRACEEGEDYRFGFNDAHKDNEIAGIGNHLDFGERGYDPRRVGWWTPDKLAAKYPGVSPYVFCRDNPIIKYDPDGNTDYTATVQVNKNTKGEITKTITVNMVYAVINVSKNPMFNANEVSGGQYKASAFSGSTSYKENGKTVNVNIQTNIQYRLVENISQVKKGENVMLVVDDVLPMRGDKHPNSNPIARGAFEGNVIAVESNYKNNLNTIWHEMGHNLGFWFPNNKQDPVHSSSPNNIMYKNITNTTSVSPEDLNSGFSDVIKKDAGTYNIEGMRGGDVQNKAKEFLDANYKYDQSKAQKAGL